MSNHNGNGHDAAASDLDIQVEAHEVDLASLHLELLELRHDVVALRAEVTAMHIEMTRTLGTVLARLELV